MSKYPAEKPEEYVFRRIEASAVKEKTAAQAGKTAAQAGKTAAQAGKTAAQAGKKLRGNCWPVVVPETAEPAGLYCVYSAVGGSLTPSPAFRGGSPLTCSFQISIADRDFSNVREAADAVVASLRAGGRMLAGTGPVDSYNPDLDRFQRAVTVKVIV